MISHLNFKSFNGASFFYDFRASGTDCCHQEPRLDQTNYYSNKPKYQFLFSYIEQN